MFMNEQLMNYINCYAEYFQNVPGMHGEGCNQVAAGLVR